MNVSSNIPNGYRGKDTELKRVYQAFFERPLTMKEVDKLTGIMRESVCWYCRELRRSERLFPVGVRVCSVTKHKAIIWTTNVKLVPAKSQLELFQ